MLAIAIDHEMRISFLLSFGDGSGNSRFVGFAGKDGRYRIIQLLKLHRVNCSRRDLHAINPLVICWCDNKQA